MLTGTISTAKPVLHLEKLESREVPAILIQIDYSYDTGFFTNNPEARATLERVAAELGNSLNANLSAIAPGGGNNWTATFFNPATGGQASIGNLTVGANTLRLFVGARDIPGSTAGFGGYGGYSISGSQAWINVIQTRGHSGFAPWGGSITFDSGLNWHFGQTTTGLGSNELDFYSVATHELGHVLGLGTSSQWQSLSQGGYFRGGNAISVYGAAVPLTSDGAHWADGITLGGQPVSLDPSINYGVRIGWTSLDAAALRDIGWGAASAAPPASQPAPEPAPAPPPYILVPIAGANGVITQYAFFNGQLYPTGQQWVPFPGYRGTFQQTFADFDADGAYDVVLGTPYPGVGVITIISGRDGHFIGAPRLTLGGGVVAIGLADVDGDGLPEFFTGEGSPVKLFVYDVSGGSIVPHAAFQAYGTPGRAAIQSAGEVNREGYGDTVARAPESETAAEQQARLEGPSTSEATYTVSAAPVKHQCICSGCRALAELVSSETDTKPAPAVEDELLSTVSVA